MAVVSTVAVDRADGEVRDMCAKAQAAFGYVPNWANMFSHRPQVMAVWSRLLASARANLDGRRYELVTLAAARALRSSHCMLAHGSVLRREFYPAGRLAAIAEGAGVGDLAPAHAAAMAFAEQVARDAAAITASDVQRLRDCGLSDADIFDVAAVAAARRFFSKRLDALGAEPDAVYDGLEDELKRCPTPGRPIGAHPPERLP